MEYDLSLDGSTVTLRFPGFGVSVSANLDTVVTRLTDGSRTLRALKPFLLGVVVEYVRGEIENGQTSAE